jgi:hypothetical protein
MRMMTMTTGKMKGKTTMRMKTTTMQASKGRRKYGTRARRHSRRAKS